MTDLKTELRRLADETQAPPIDPAREAALLEAFDAAWAGQQAPRPSPRSRRTVYVATVVALAAGIVLAVVVGARRGPKVAEPALTARATVSAMGWPIAARVPEVPDTSDVSDVSGSRVRRPARRTVSDVSDVSDSEFVVWPGAGDLPRFESGQLMRMRMNASDAASLGFRRLPASTVVQADVLVGQDGYARAVRLVR